MIKKDSHIPIYYQIETEIKKLAETKDLKPGDLIPSEREFAEKYEVSRMTVRQAVNNLVNEGILVRRWGKGTFIAEPKIGLTSQRIDKLFRGHEIKGHEARHENARLRRHPVRPEHSAQTGDT